MKYLKRISNAKISGERVKVRLLLGSNIKSSWREKKRSELKFGSDVGKNGRIWRVNEVEDIGNRVEIRSSRPSFLSNSLFLRLFERILKPLWNNVHRYFSSITLVISYLRTIRKEKLFLPSFICDSFSSLIRS